jgi:phosphatidylglycerol:prolipoprotein diacylglycerol transferase
LLVFAALIVLVRPRFRERPGAVFFCYVGLYSIGRFAIEALRLDSFWLGPFRVPQLASVAGVGIAIAGLAWLSRRRAAVA